MMAPASTVLPPSFYPIDQDVEVGRNVVGKLQILPTDAESASGDRAAETLDIRLIFRQQRTSLRRIKEPTWKTIARYPPPDSARPMPSSRGLAVGR